MLTKKRVVAATALVVVAAAIGTVPAIAGQDPKPERTAVGPAVSWTSTDGAAYISDYSDMPKSKKWRRDHKHSTGNWPGRWQDEVGPEEVAPGQTGPSTATSESVIPAPSGPSSTTESGYTAGNSTSSSSATGTPSTTTTSAPTVTATATGTATGTATTGAPTSSATASVPALCSTPTATETTAPAEGSTEATTTSTSTKTTGSSDGSAMNPCSTTNRSGLPWGASGLYMAGSSAANAEAFAAWRGAPVDVVVDWPARQTWDDVINPTWIFDAWKDTPYMKALGVAPIPEGDSSATMAGCAAGQYNDKWKQFGKNFADNGMGDSIIRLGWEFNGNWYLWSASNPGQFAQCWRQIVTSARTTAPDLKWDWTVNRGVSAGLADATQAYPGDEFVDIVGVDSYDMWPGAASDQTWDEHLNGDFGLKFWADFAKKHGKKMSVPEWGCYPGTAHAGNNGGDNAFYIEKMVEFFTSMGSDLAYEAYFNENASYYAGAIFQPTQIPKAAGEYQTLIAAADSEEPAETTSTP
ncbi:glycoside hydrolase family 26 protein [Kineosporia mesophila]|uniref:glycoside hydrolase family 26 protein n=1 Tax=Kineosporia mesophila TaxID=566012 RepID=UPI001E2ACFA7|nr:glycoside hydrolase family 26 protein [Kineosporia mesophila]